MDLAFPVPGFKVSPFPDAGDLFHRNGHTVGPGDQRARCRFCTGPVPNPDPSAHGGGHSCGFHAWHDLEDALEYPVSGAIAGVILWGKLFFDEKFVRAEHQRIVALSKLPDPSDARYPPHRSWRGRMNAIHGRWLEKAAVTYGVPLVKLEDLERETMRYGIPYRV